MKADASDTFSTVTVVHGDHITVNGQTIPMGQMVDTKGAALILDGMGFPVARPKTLATMRTHGTGPAFRRILGHHIRYVVQDLVEWANDSMGAPLKCSRQGRSSDECWQ